MTQQKILIVEDEQSLREVLQYNLEQEGFQITTAADGTEGLRLARRIVPDLVLLDIMMPGMDGLTVCRELRSDPVTQQTRIMIITARGEETDEIVGFSMGADDYVTKPFRVKPVVHRIRALLRRPDPADTRRDVITYGSLTIDNTDRTVTLDDQHLDLTPTEFLIVWTFVRQPGRVFTRDELLDTSRGRDANAFSRTIDVHIRSLRKKLGDSSDLIETVRGVGYRLRRL